MTALLQRDWKYVARDSETSLNGELPETDLLDTLWDAARILEQHNVLSKFGHVSVRSKYKPDWFYLLRGGDADTVTKQATYAVCFTFPMRRIRTSSTTQTNTGAERYRYEITAGLPVPSSVLVHPYSEHYIHASLYCEFPDIGAVIHSHSQDVLPFSAKGASLSDLRPIIHMAGFLGLEGPKIFDTGSKSHRGQADYSANFLVNSYHIARSFTSCFSESSKDNSMACSAIALQAAHGFTAVGKDLGDVVYRAIYTQENARLLMQARSMYREEEIRFLDAYHVDACMKMNDNAAQKAFMGWRADLRA